MKVQNEVEEILRNQKENVTPQLAIEKVQPATQKTGNDAHLGALYDPCLEH